MHNSCYQLSLETYVCCFGKLSHKIHEEALRKHHVISLSVFKQGIKVLLYEFCSAKSPCHQETPFMSNLGIQDELM